MEETIDPNYTRVTEVFKPFVSFDHIDPNVLQNACERGTRFHTYAEMYANKEWFPDPDPEMCCLLSGFYKWFDEMVEQVVLLEWRGYNEELMLTGAVDLICRLKNDDHLTIIDYKTAATASKSWNLQTAAYAFLAEQGKGLKIDRRIALQISKKGKAPKVHEYTDHQGDWNLYKGALGLYRYFNGR